MARAVTRELRRLRKVSSPHSLTPPTPWTARAACQGWDPAQWMDDDTGQPTAAAKAVCAACPVRAACLAHALDYDEPWGIWGGLTARERVAHRLGVSLPSDAPDAERPFMGATGPRKTKPPVMARSA